MTNASIDSRAPFNFAHALTCLRMGLTPLFVLTVEWCRLNPTWPCFLTVGTLYFVICGTDYYDGEIARHLGVDSEAGKLFDNVADITFLLVSLAYCTSINLAPWWIPVTVGCAFAQYSLDSWWLSRHRKKVALVRNRTGHWAGVVNYVGVGVITLPAWMPIQLFPSFFLRMAFLAWFSYLVLAIANRMLFFRRCQLAGTTGTPNPRKD